MKLYKVIRLRLPRFKYRTRRSRVLKINKIIRDLNISKYIYIAAILALTILIFKLMLSFGKNTEYDENTENINNVESNSLGYYSNEAEAKEKNEKKANKFLIILKEVLPFFDFTNESDDNENNYVNDEKKEIITYSNMELLDSFESIKNYMYSIDTSAYVAESDLELASLLNDYTKVDFTSSKPKILIFHTHSSESFTDSRQGEMEDTIVGVGQTLAKILSEKYKISVVHDMGKYDVVDGKEARDGSYERMEPEIEKLLKKYPSVEVLIDLHRDGVADDKRLICEINNKSTAKIMFFNGICRLNDNGIPKGVGLENKYIKENLSLSFNMQAMANTLYPDFTRKIYIKPYRYSLNMKPMSLLIEAGANTNTVSEVKNAMEPLAEILYKVLSK